MQQNSLISYLESNDTCGGQISPRNLNHYNFFFFLSRCDSMSHFSDSFLFKPKINRMPNLVIMCSFIRKISEDAPIFFFSKGRTNFSEHLPKPKTSEEDPKIFDRTPTNLKAVKGTKMS